MSENDPFLPLYKPRKVDQGYQRQPILNGEEHPELYWLLGSLNLQESPPEPA